MAHFETWFDLTKASASHSLESGYGSGPAGFLIVSHRVNRYRNCLLVCEDCLRSPILLALVFFFCLFFNVWEVKWLNAAFQINNHLIFNFFSFLSLSCNRNMKMYVLRNYPLEFDCASYEILIVLLKMYVLSSSVIMDVTTLFHFLW